MRFDEYTMLKAFREKDPAFDGRFFVGISSTKIYCRPICQARLPKPENCHFYPTAAAAEQAGYRPCLLCRPERAPGLAVSDSVNPLAYRSAKLLEEFCGSGFTLDELARRLACTGRHLRRVFVDEYQVAPVQYLQTCKLLLAKHLLTDTGLPVNKITKAAGCGSQRRFNDLFQKQYHLSPTRLRKQAVEEKVTAPEIKLSLGYRPPYRWDELLNFFAARAIPGVEAIRGGEYCRTVRLPDGNGAMVHGWLRVGHNPAKCLLTLTLSGTLLAVLPQTLARVRRQFDLDCAPDAVYAALSCMNDIRSGLCVAGLRLPGCFDPFEIAVRAVLGQQITVKAARTLADRMVKAYGTPLETNIEGLTHLFPSPEEVIRLPFPIENCFGPLGVTGSRSRTILELARRIQNREIDLSYYACPEDTLRKLTAVDGIGNWTAQYIAMRAMGWTDAFLETDAGVKKAFSNRPGKEWLALAEAWRPWRSYAVINLWNSLSQIQP